jgi:pyridoxal phosphate enzyme (YggS family)
MLADRLKEIEGRIVRACERSGRSREEITLLAVTKTFTADVIREAYRHGLRDFGENYIQEFEGKAAEVAALEGARFYFIGHLQSNKSRRAAELFDVIESVDTGKLARRLSEAPVRRAGTLEVLIEVKLSEEEAKSGADPAGLSTLIREIQALPNIRLTGLMTMPPWSEDPEASRPYFRRLREMAARFGLPKLSMGMSGDFEVAIEEGATEIRVGTALFGSRG